MICLLLLSATTQNRAQNLVWGKAIGGDGALSSKAMAVDASGNSYLTGTFIGTTDFDPSPTATASLTAGSSPAIFIAKYDPAGNYVWAKSLIGTNTSVVSDIAVDASGNCYITGQFSGTLDFDPDPETSSSQGGDRTLYVAKYDTNGNLGWAFTEGTPCIGYSLTVDATNHVLVTGLFAGRVTFGTGTPNQVSLIGTGSTDMFVTSYEASSGSLNWATRVGGSAGTNVKGTNIEVDPAGNVYVKGQLSGSVDFDPTAGTNSITGPVFLAKYNSAGTYQWADKVPGSSSPLAYKGLAVDQAGNCYLTGDFTGTVDVDPSSSVVSFTSTGFSDSFLAKYDTDGNYVWGKPIYGSGIDVGVDVVVDAAGASYVCGLFTGTTDFDPSTGVASLTAAGTASVFLAKYNSSGEYIWAGKIDHGTEAFYCIGLDGAANLYVAGVLGTATDVDLSANTVLLTPGSSFNSYLVKYSGCQSITNQPAAGLAVCTGSSATATVGISGAASGYQWFRNGTAVDGQTSATLSLTNVQVANAGDYVVVVSGACQSVTSTAFSLTVNAAPSANINPSNPALTCTSPTVSLTATGGNSYHWNDNSINAIRTASVEGLYSVTVTSGSGCTAIASTTVSSQTVLSLVTGASLPQANVGVVLSLTASGATTYQWTAPASAPLTTPATSSAVSASLTTAGVQTFTVVASSGICSQSALVSVTALAGPDLTAIMSLPDGNFQAGESKGLLMQVQEVNGSTASGSIIITITVPVGYSVSFDNSLTSINVSGGSTVAVQNNKWHVSSNIVGQQLSLVLNGGESVTASTTLNVGFLITRTTANAGSTSNITINVADDSAGSYDVNRLNNVYSRIISGL
ncbi:hypothetical protein GCM10028809_02080 [Spirosoma gilvum]